MSRPMSVLLPTPAAPVKAVTRVGFVGGPRRSRISPMCSPRATRLSSCASARRSPWRNRSSSTSSMARLAPLLEVRDDVRQRRPRPQDARHSHLQQLGNVAFRNDAADQDADVIESRLAQQLEYAGNQCEMGTAQNAEADPVRVLVAHGP